MYNICINIIKRESYIRLTSSLFITSHVAFFSIFLCPVTGFVQSDSLHVQTELGLRGRWQTGNVDQIVLNPHLKMILSRQDFQVKADVDYQLLHVGERTINSDFWSQMTLRLKPDKKFYPMSTLYYGFAKSYKIDHSLVGGIGLGSNIVKKSQRGFLRTELFAGYLDIGFEDSDVYSTAALGSVFEAGYIPSEKLSISNKLQTYHSLTEGNIWGAGNYLQLAFHISDSLTIVISHNTIFNNTTNPGIEKINTLMMFGVSYRLN